MKAAPSPVTFDTAVAGLTSLVKHDASFKEPVLIPPSPLEVSSALNTLTQVLERENGNILRYILPYQPKKEQVEKIKGAVTNIDTGIRNKPEKFIRDEGKTVAESLLNFMGTADDGDQYGLQDAVRPLFTFMLQHSNPDSLTDLTGIIAFLPPDKAILAIDDYSRRADIDRQIDGDLPILRISFRTLYMLSLSFGRHPRETKLLQENNSAPFVLNEALNRISAYNVSNEAFNADFAQSWATAIADLLITHPQTADLPLIREYFLAGTAKKLLKAKNDGTFQTTMTGIIPRLPPANATSVLNDYLSVNRVQPEVRTAGDQTETASEFVNTQAYRRYMQAFNALGACFGNRYGNRKNARLTDDETDWIKTFSTTVNTSVLIMLNHEPPFKYRDQMRAAVAAKYQNLAKQYPYLTQYLKLK